MTDNVPENAGEAVDPDLQEALFAAFGDEAAEWLEENTNDSEIPAGAENSHEELSHLLQDVSDSLGELEDIEAEANSPDLQVDAGPRHVVFQVGDQQFALPLSDVREIDRLGSVTTLPRTPNWLRGVTNLRGQILSLTDFRSLLSLPEHNVVGEKIIVVHSDQLDTQTALVVDRVLGIRNLKSKTSPLSGVGDRVAEFADAVSIDEQVSTIVIHPDKLLGCSELTTFSDG